VSNVCDARVAELLERARAELKKLCEIAYPSEACGALLGTGDGDLSPWRVTRVISAPNRHSSDRRRFYLIAPELQLAAEREADHAGEQVLGYFHSHPDCSALPSDRDQAQAWPSYLYVICSVVKARTVGIAAFAKIAQDGPLLRVPVAPTDPVKQSTLEIPPCPSLS
jgi:proteasome lid subunit RPN8/RPN11